MAEVLAVRAPVENVNDETIAIVRWLVQNGDRVEAGAELLLAETTKTSFDIPAPAAGFVWKVAPDEGEVATRAVLCYIGEDAESAREAALGPRPEVADRVQVAPTQEQAGAAEPARFSSKALALLKSHGLEPADFAGRGLVRERDVLERVAAGVSTSGSPGVLATPPVAPVVEARPGRPVPASGVATRSAKLTRSKRLEVQYLRSAAASTIPSLATVAVPTSGFFSHASARPDLLGLPGAAIIFECSRLLRTYPAFNAYHDEGSIHHYEDVNIGYAFDFGRGLKVPVIRNADRKSLPDIGAEKQQRLVEYLDDSLPVEALAGGTFTISDLSGEDVFHFNPMLNQGQSAILGVCAEVRSAPASTGFFNLVLAFDHQVAEGRTAAAFLRDLRDRLAGHEQSFGARAAAAETTEPFCSFCLRPHGEIDAAQQFLLRAVADRHGNERAICSICVQGW